MANGFRVLCYVARSRGLIVVLTRPFPRNWGMAEDLGAPEARQLSRVGTINCTNQQPLQCRSAVPGPVWVGSKWLLAFPRVPVTPGTPFIFSPCCPLTDCRSSAHSFFKTSDLFSFFSCPFLARLRLLILLLLMRSNVHPNPGSIYACSVCARNVTWRGK